MSMKRKNIHKYSIHNAYCSFHRVNIELYFIPYIISLIAKAKENMKFG